jgi:peptide deformylase
MYDIVIGHEDAILRTICQPVEKFDENLEKIIQKMKETMLSPSGSDKVRGVGLAAPQVNLDMRILLITLNIGTKKKQKVLPLINPQILECSKEMVKMEEGCLSLPGIFGKVTRPAKVKVKWQNNKGSWCEKKFSGWDARIFLHENDHLNGILFTRYLREH